MTVARAPERFPFLQPEVGSEREFARVERGLGRRSTFCASPGVIQAADPHLLVVKCRHCSYNKFI